MRLLYCKNDLTMCCCQNTKLRVPFGHECKSMWTLNETESRDLCFPQSLPSIVCAYFQHGYFCITIWPFSFFLSLFPPRCLMHHAGFVVIRLSFIVKRTFESDAIDSRWWKCGFESYLFAHDTQIFSRWYVHLDGIAVIWNITAPVLQPRLSIRLQYCPIIGQLLERCGKIILLLILWSLYTISNCICASHYLLQSSPSFWVFLTRTAESIRQKVHPVIRSELSALKMDLEYEGWHMRVPYEDRLTPSQVWVNAQGHLYHKCKRLCRNSVLKACSKLHTSMLRVLRVWWERVLAWRRLVTVIVFVEIGGDEMTLGESNNHFGEHINVTIMSKVIKGPWMLNSLRAKLNGFTFWIGVIAIY